MPSSVNQAYAPLMGKSTEQLYNESAIIVVGNVISAAEIQNGTRTEYVIQPQEYLKPTNPENMTQTINAQGIGSKNHYVLYFRTYQVGDRALFFLQKENDYYLISPYSIGTQSNCNGKQLLDLNFSPGDFSIVQENNTYEKMFTDKPINITGFVHNNFDLKSRDVEIDFTVHTPRSDLILTEKKQVHIEECKGFAESSWSFMPTLPGRYGISVESHDIHGEGFGGGSFCCITVVDRNGTAESVNTTQAQVSNLTIVKTAPSWCVGCIPSDQLQTNGILIPLVVAALVIGVWFLLFRHFKD